MQEERERSVGEAARRGVRARAHWRRLHLFQIICTYFLSFFSFLLIKLFERLAIYSVFVLLSMSGKICTAFVSFLSLNLRPNTSFYY